MRNGRAHTRQEQIKNKSFVFHPLMICENIPKLIPQEVVIATRQAASLSRSSCDIFIFKADYRKAVIT